jgi:protein-S-isoprenylcysteine O-methyltransferase Ste14
LLAVRDADWKLSDESKVVEPILTFELEEDELAPPSTLITKNSLSASMESKRYESPIFTAGLFVIIFMGLIVTAMDPTGMGAKNGGVINDMSFSGVHLALLIVGSVFVFAGIVIRLVAIATLRKNFSGALRIREDHTLIKNGIYRSVRHPAYLGAILLFAGIPVMFSSLFGFLVMLLLVPYLLHRIRLEERMLIERFGKDYEEYMRSSKRLIPFVY